MKRLLVCGGRDYRNGAHVYTVLDKLHEEHHFTDIIQGGAGGADALAAQWARTKPELVRWVCQAAWRDLSHPDAIIRTRADGVQYDAKAGHRRNKRMLEWKPDVVVAFPGQDGTRDMMKQARAAGVLVIEAPSGWSASSPLTSSQGSKPTASSDAPRRS